MADDAHKLLETALAAAAQVRVERGWWALLLDHLATRRRERDCHRGRHMADRWVKGAYVNLTQGPGGPIVNQMFPFHARCVHCGAAMIPVPDLREIATLATELIDDPLPDVMGQVRRQIAAKIAALHEQYPDARFSLDYDGGCVVIRMHPAP